MDVRKWQRESINVGMVMWQRWCTGSCARLKYGFESNEKWYEHEPESVVKNEGVTLLWDVNIQCDHIIEARRPDIVLINKQEKSCLIIDIAIPGEVRVHE